MNAKKLNPNQAATVRHVIVSVIAAKKLARKEGTPFCRGMAVGQVLAAKFLARSYKLGINQ